jgi:hypothetical protein
MEVRRRQLWWTLIFAMAGGLCGLVVGLALDQWGVKAGVPGPTGDIPAGVLLSASGTAAGTVLGMVRAFSPVFRTWLTENHGPQEDYDDGSESPSA